MIPQVYVGMPHYGDVSLRAARAHCSPSTRRDMPEDDWVQPVRWGDSEGSVTPSTFNMMLGQALMLRDAGIVTHFAMIHSDIEPDGPWLNVLWREMRSHGLGLISAVAPIKNHEGKTSTAFGERSDPWVADRYVMVDDRELLPVTFTGADACRPGEVLLVNTGLMLADLRLPVWDGFAFQWHHRITLEPNGNRKTWFRPEDWEMSRALDAAGVPYGATWAVELTHVGRMRWPSHVEAAHACG